MSNVITHELVERILAEGPIGMAAAAKLYGTYRAGRPTHPSTPTHHHLQGVRLPDGSIIRLEAIRIGGRLMTSRASVARFLADQQPSPTAAVAPVRSPAVRQRASDQAAAALDAAGI